MTPTCCMTSRCEPAAACTRYEDDAGKHLLHRTCADFSEEPIHRPDRTTACPFFIDKHAVADTQSRPH